MPDKLNPERKPLKDRLENMLEATRRMNAEFDEIHKIMDEALIALKVDSRVTALAKELTTLARSAYDAAKTRRGSLIPAWHDRHNAMDLRVERLLQKVIHALLNEKGPAPAPTCPPHVILNCDSTFLPAGADFDAVLNLLDEQVGEHLALIVGLATLPGRNAKRFVEVKVNQSGTSTDELDALLARILTAIDPRIGGG